MRSPCARTSSAAAAWAAGHFAAETVQVDDAPLERDECIRPESSMESLAKLKPVFRQGGSVTAGNASPMNDGAAAMLVMSARGVEMSERDADGADRQPRQPAASIRICTASARSRRRAPRCVEPGIGWGDLAAVELNEAFAAQSLACLREWPELDPAIVNQQGGAIAIGHPLGCSGVRIVTTLAHHLRRTGGRYGLAAMCIGVGQGIAIVLENTHLTARGFGTRVPALGVEGRTPGGGRWASAATASSDSGFLRATHGSATESGSAPSRIFFTGSSSFLPRQRRRDRRQRHGSRRARGAATGRCAARA